MACQCNNRVHDDYKENVLFGTLVLSNGELAQAQFWFPSEKNPSPNAGAPYSLKLNKLIGLGKTSYDIFHDDKFLVDSSESSILVKQEKKLIFYSWVR